MAIRNTIDPRAASVALVASFLFLFGDAGPLRAIPSSWTVEEPRAYADGALTTVNGLAFSRDGKTVYVSRWVDGVDYRGKPRARLFSHVLVDGEWGQPEPLPFSRDFTDYQPVLSPDESRLYFTSTRPLPGTSDETRQNIWFVERRAAGWGSPEVVEGLVTPGWDGYAVQTRSGRLYFVSDRPGGKGEADIWMADTEPDGGFESPVNVSVLNSEHGDSDIFVDPDERFVVFHRSETETGAVEFWIAFRAEGEWKVPRRLDEIVGPGAKLSPTVSADGRYFFHVRDSSIFRVELCSLLRADERERLNDPMRCECRQADARGRR